MRRLEVSWLAALAIVVLGADGGMAAETCIASPGQPQIEVRTDLGAPALDTSQGIRALTGRPRQSTGGGAAPDNFYTFGLTEIQIEHQAEFQSLGDPRPEIGYCWSLAEARLTIIVTTKVYVAREIERDSCIWNEVIAHEKRHVAIDRELLPHLVEAVRAKMRQIAGQSLAAPDSEAAGAAFSALVSAGISEVGRKYSVGRNKRQLAIDTPEEYSRFGRACGSAEIAAIMSRAGIQ